MNIDSLQEEQRVITIVIKQLQTNNLNNHGMFLKLDNTYFNFICFLCLKNWFNNLY